MLHELLFHLLDGKNKQTLLDLLDSDDFIHQGDQEILDQIMSIGSDYRLLQDSHHRITSRCCVCIDTDADSTTQMDSSFSDVRPGLYLTAFCNGLDEVLESYREEVVRLEETMMENPQLSMSYVLSRAMKFVPLFALIKSMLQMIKVQKVHGCLLVGWLHSYSNYGIEYIVQTANKIQSSVNVIFYKQLANWLICGDLVDEYAEFFIEQSPEYLNDSTVTLKSATTTLLDGTTNKSATVVGGVRGCKVDPVKRYRLRLENLPEVIPVNLAEDILFTGQMVWIVRDQDSTIDVWQNKSLDLIQRISQLSTTLHLPSFTSTVAKCKSLISQYLWSTINTPPPSPPSTITTRPRRPTPTMKHQQQQDDRSLRHHLRLIRDYYCLGRGELFQHYVMAAKDMPELHQERGDGQQQQMLDVTVGGGGVEGEARWGSKRLDAIFHETARRLYGEGDRSHERFRITADGEMQFHASWPLDVLVFNACTLQQYTRIFQFLLRIQRTQTHLHQLWWTQHRCCTKQRSSRSTPPTTTSTTSSIAGSTADAGGCCWALRHNLQFVVDNLQYYLHVDVIEAEFVRFERSMDGASDTADVTTLHCKFISGLLSRTFVMGQQTSSSSSASSSAANISSSTNSADHSTAAVVGKNDRMVYNIICHLLDLCDEFCSAVTMFDGPLDAHTLEPFQQRFQTMIEMLLRILYSLHEKVSSGYHVLQLLHRLDFNRWYTQTLSASDLNLTKLRI